jgi:hypothetical protein
MEKNQKERNRETRKRENRIKNTSRSAHHKEEAES